MLKLKKLWEDYKAPTPTQWRHFGNSLVAASALASGISFLGNDSTMLRIVAITLMVGKFITEFKAEK